MSFRSVWRACALVALVAAFLAVPRGAAWAVPSFATQTGQPCSACHIGAYGPQLTPFGMAFKIGGYTQTGGDGWQSYNPLSAMIIGSFTNTNSAVPADQVTPHYNTNNNFALDQISVFLAGRLGDNTGGFSQFTYSNVSNAVNVDNIDLRPYTRVFDAGGKDLRIGFTINNAPTVQDPYNTTFAWGYPYVASRLAPTPSASPILASGFVGNSIGYTAYAWYDRSLYLEAGGYTTRQPLGSGAHRQRLRRRQHAGRGALCPRRLPMGLEQPVRACRRDLHAAPMSTQVGTFSTDGSNGPRQLSGLRHRRRLPCVWATARTS